MQDNLRLHLFLHIVVVVLVVAFIILIHVLVAIFSSHMYALQVFFSAIHKCFEHHCMRYNKNENRRGPHYMHGTAPRVDNHEQQLDFLRR